MVIFTYEKDYRGELERLIEEQENDKALNRVLESGLPQLQLVVSHNMVRIVNLRKRAIFYKVLWKCDELTQAFGGSISAVADDCRSDAEIIMHLPYLECASFQERTIFRCIWDNALRFDFSPRDPEGDLEVRVFLEFFDLVPLDSLSEETIQRIGRRVAEELKEYPPVDLKEIEDSLRAFRNKEE